MQLQTRSSLFQIMACRLVGAKPSSEPTLTHCQLDHWEDHFSEILTKIQQFPRKEINLKMSSANWWLFCLGINVLNHGIENIIDPSAETFPERYEHYNIQSRGFEISRDFGGKTYYRLVDRCPDIISVSRNVTWWKYGGGFQMIIYAKVKKDLY